MVSERTIHEYKTKKIIRTKYKTLISFHQELRVLADEVTDQEQKVRGPKDMFCAFVVGKSYKTHGAVLLLSKNGFGEDASILTRSIYENMVTLLHILQDETDEQAYRYFDYDWILREKMFKSVAGKQEIMDKVLERERNPKPEDTTIQEVKKHADIVRKRYGYKNNRWSDKSLYEMAKDVGRLDAYRTVYRLQCQLSHSLSRSLNEYAKPDQSGVVLDVGQSENWVEESLVAAFDFYFSILSAYNSHFDLGFEDKFEDLENRFVAEMSSIE